MHTHATVCIPVMYYHAELLYKKKFCTQAPPLQKKQEPGYEASFTYSRAPLDTNICVKTIQWNKLWCNFPVVSRSQSGERAVSLVLHILTYNS